MSKLSISVFFSCITTILIVGCGATKTKQNGQIDEGLFSQIDTKNHFVGLLVVDPSSKDTLYAINSKKYFTPASTTKIFTLYTVLKLLPQYIPTLRYIERNDTLYFEGTGDPTQLHPYFNDSTAVHFLNKHKNLVWCKNNYKSDVLGPGWAWEDYQYYYQVERGALPLYGNVATIHFNGGVNVAPNIFKKNIIKLNYTKNRELESNTFYYAPTRRDTVAIPFRTDTTLTKKLLEAVVRRPMLTKDLMPENDKSVLFGLPSDTVYKRMMHESDNFLAEQLLILSSGMLSDTLDGERARGHIMANELSNLRQLPRWVDGSGLSRYNLFTPESMVYVLDKLREDIPQERLFDFFIPNDIQKRSSFSERESNTPYIYAKSGSVGNNYSLNGYILTKSGKLLIFSFMNNHFNLPSKKIRMQVQRVLKRLHESH